MKQTTVLLLLAAVALWVTVPCAKWVAALLATWALWSDQDKPMIKGRRVSVADSETISLSDSDFKYKGNAAVGRISDSSNRFEMDYYGVIGWHDPGSPFPMGDGKKISYLTSPNQTNYINHTIVFIDGKFNPYLQNGVRLSIDVEPHPDTQREASSRIMSLQAVYGVNSVADLTPEHIKVAHDNQWIRIKRTVLQIGDFYKRDMPDGNHAMLLRDGYRKIRKLHEGYGYQNEDQIVKSGEVEKRKNAMFLGHPHYEMPQYSPQVMKKVREGKYESRAIELGTVPTLMEITNSQPTPPPSPPGSAAGGGAQGGAQGGSQGGSRRRRSGGGQGGRRTRKRLSL